MNSQKTENKLVVAEVGFAGVRKWTKVVKMCTLSGFMLITIPFHDFKASFARFFVCLFVCFCCVIACASSGLSELNFPLFSFGKGKKLWFLSEITSRWLLKLTKVPMVSAVHKSGLWRFLFTICLFIHIFLAALGLHCCTRIFSSCSEKGLLSRCDAWPLTVVAPLIAGYRLWLLGLSSCDAWA